MWKVISFGRRKSSPREIRACDGCRSRKVKCSNSIHTQNITRATTQPCTRCQRSGRRCLYNCPIKDGDLSLESNLVRLHSNSPSDESQSVTFRPVIVPTPDATPTFFPPITKLPEGPQESFYDELQVPLDKVDTWTGDLWPIDDPSQEMNQNDSNLGLQNLLEIPLTHFNENAENPLGITYPWINSTACEAPSTGETQKPVSLLTELLAAGEESRGEGSLENDIQNFLQHMYTAFPIVDKDDLTHLTNVDVMNLNADFKILCFAIKMFTLVREYRMQPTRELENKLVTHVEALEEERHMQGITDHPDLNTVVVSLFLFTAYNVLWKHSLAFLYLGEAIDLFDLVSRQIEDKTLDERRLRRLARLELVLFNTTAASYSIYGPHGTTSRRRPILSPRIRHLLLESPDPTEVHVDKLLLRLTYVHATSISQSYPDLLLGVSRLLQEAGIPTDPPTTDFACVIQYPSDQQSTNSPPGITRQTADIHISYHWRALEKMAVVIKSHSRGTAAMNVEEQRKLMQVFCDKGASVLAWTGSVDKGTLRIIGLGKLASIALDIYKMAYGFRVGSTVPETCKTIIAGLLGTIVSLDYERAFADRLHNCIESITGNISTPRYLECTSAMEPGWSILNEWLQEHLSQDIVNPDHRLQ